MAENNRCIIQDREQSALAEAFRALRTSILEMQTEHPLQTILFAGASSGDGNAMSAANVAVTLAYSGKRVILMDCDLRSPILHDVFDLRDVGLTNIINDENALDEVLQTTNIHNLSVLASGPLPFRAFEVLSNAKMRVIMEQAKKLADYVILNSTPLVALANEVVADACMLASKVDGVVLVIDARSVRVKAAQNVMAMLRGARARMIGAVLNNVKDDKEVIYHFSDTGGKN